MNLSVIPMEREHISLMIDYFVDATPEFLIGMGADPSKLPTKEKWKNLLLTDFDKPLKEKSFFYTVWLLDGNPMGHCNINKIQYGEEAFMHLHMWTSGERQKGIGSQLVRMSIPHFFEKFNLKTLFCEPYALNPAPNKTLPKLGFSFVKEYETMPGWINLYQTVRRYELTRERFEELWVE